MQKDRMGDYQNDLHAVFERLLSLEEKMRILIQRINWLENPDTAPKSSHVQQKLKEKEENL